MMQDATLAVFSAVGFAFKNWRLLAQVAVQSAAVSIVAFGSQIAHVFTKVIPAYLSWFASTWRDIFITAGSALKAFSTNVFTNIVNLFKAIKSWMSGGGFKFEWTPLMEGFENTIKALPEIAEREMGPLEMDMRAKLNDLSGELNASWEEHKAEVAARGAEATRDLGERTSESGDELKALTAKAAAAREEADKLAGTDKQSALEKLLNAGRGASESQQKIVGSFSAAALSAMGGAKSPMERMANDMGAVKRELERIAKETFEANRINQALLQEQRMGGVIG
jgi:hypothetical protein